MQYMPLLPHDEYVLPSNISNHDDATYRLFLLKYLTALSQNVEVTVNKEIIPCSVICYFVYVVTRKIKTYIHLQRNENMTQY